MTCRRCTLPRCAWTAKVRFRDKREAVAALHNAAARRWFARLDHIATRRAETRCYQCEACQGWHLTSQPKHEAKAFTVRVLCAG